jgi:hypothetical protein
MTTMNRRAWYKLHLSTWFIALVVLTVLLLIVVPGQFSGVPPSPSIIVPIYYAHGWPLVWLDRSVSSPVVFQEVRDDPTKLRWAEAGDIYWIDRKSWPVTGTFFLRWKGLALDICFIIAIVGTFSCSWEFWRRRRFQYSIRALLVVSLLFSMLMAYWRAAAVRWSREKPLVDQLENLDSYAVTTSAAPDWLCRLVGEDRFPCTVTELYVSSDQDKLKSALDVASGFAKLHSLEFDFLNDRAMEMVAAKFANPKPGAPTLCELTIVGTDLTDAGYRAIAQLTELRQLEIDNWVGTGVELEIVATLPHLQRLSIDGRGLTQQDIDSFRKRCPGCEVEWVNEDAPPGEKE